MKITRFIYHPMLSSCKSSSSFWDKCSTVSIALRMLNCFVESSGSGTIFIVITGCGGNFHKRCAMKIPNNCNESRIRSDTNRSTLSIPRKFSDAASITSTASNETFYSAFSEVPSPQPASPSPSTGSRRMTWTCGRPVAIDKLVNKLEIPHTFVIHSYRRPTVCNVCRKLVSLISLNCYNELP